MKKILIFSLTLCLTFGVHAQKQKNLEGLGSKQEKLRLNVSETENSKSSDCSYYLMVYHKDADHSLHMALSHDGYSWTSLNNDKAVVSGDTIAQQHGIRDPHIYRGPDGTYYIAATDLHIFGKRAGYRETEL